jgi:hypothetical protein
VTTLTIGVWFAMGGTAAACLTGGLAVAAAALHAPARGAAPARRSPAAPRAGYVILAEPGHVAPWQSATHPEPWPAVPDLVHSDQLAQLAAIGREVDQMHAEARRLGL